VEGIELTFQLCRDFWGILCRMWTH